jgi:DNA-binding winged helix-turn-helix (wHTH) protein/Tol biopolymer transport system component
MLGASIRLYMLGAPTRVQFGAFEFDFKLHELRKRGLRLRLSASQMRLLTLFLAKPGVLITRDDIAAHLWKDPQNIDVSNGINTAVNRLRYTLNDDTAEPVYIETVIGLGYRFIAAVEQASKEGEGLSGSKADLETASGQSTDLDSEDAPAAVWMGIDEPENRQQLETPAVLSRMIATRPDPGRRRWKAAAVAAVAIFAGGAASVWLYWSHVSASLPPVPVISGRFQSVTFNDSDDKVTAVAISPGGETIAYSDHSGISLIWLDSRATRLLASPPQFQVRRIDWYPDGKRLAVSGTSKISQKQQIWQLSLQGAAPRLLAEDADLAAVSPDGSWIAFTKHQDTEIDIASADGGNPRKVLTAGDKESFPFLLWSRSGRYLIDERSSKGGSSTDETPIGRTFSPLNSLEEQNKWSYESVDVRSGKVLAREENIHFDSGYILPDGRLFYPESTVSKVDAATRLMMVRTDPPDGRFLSPPVLVLSIPGDQAKALSSSDNGKQIAIVINRSTADLFVANLRQPGPVLEGVTQLSHHAVESYPHAWTPNDDGILIENNTLGKDAVFEHSLDGSAPRLIAQLPNDAAMAEFSPDGKWILFLELSGMPNRVDAIFRVSASGGSPQQVPVSGDIEEFHCPSVAESACVLREAIDKKQFVYFALDPVKGIGQELARTAWEPSILGDWSISPDGSMVAIANHDSLHPSIRFVSLTRAAAGLKEIPVEGFGTLLGPMWAVDGRGLFVESKMESGYSLLYVDLKGHAKTLRDSPTPIWAVPSHDGTKLAFPAVTFRSNVLSQKVIEK